MASFNAEIQLSANARRALGEVNKVENAVTRLDRKAGDIELAFKLDDQQIRRAGRLLDNLERVRRVRVVVEEDARQQSSPTSGGGGNIAGLLPAVAASQAITKTVAALPAALNQSTASSKALAGALRDADDAVEKIEFELIQAFFATEKGAKAAKELAKQAKGAEFNFEELRDAAGLLPAELQEAIDKQKELNRLVSQQQRPTGGGGGRPPAGALPPGGGGRGRRGGGGAAAAAAGGALGGLRGNIATTLASLIGLNEAIQETGRILNATLNRTQGEQRIRALSEGFDSFSTVLARSSAAAEKFNISQNQANATFAQLYGRLRPLGLTLSEINTVYEGFNTAAILSGTTATEAAGAMLQLTQALGAGALRGEEFNSVSEQTPAVTRAIAEELDVPIGRLKDLAKEGRITSDVVVAALTRIKTQGADRLEAALDSPTQKVQTLTNRFEDLRVEIGKTTLPAFLVIVEGGITEVEKMADRVERLGKAFAFINRLLPDFNVNLSGVFNRMEENFPIVGRYIKVLNLVLDVLAKVEDRERAVEAGRRNFGDNYKAEERAAFEAAGSFPYGKPKPLRERLGLDEDIEDEKLDPKLVEQVEQRLRIAKQTTITEKELLDLEIQRATAVANGNEALAARIRGIQDEVRARMDLFTALENETDERIRQELKTQAALEVEKIRLRTAEELLQIERDITEELNQQIQRTIDATPAPDTSGMESRQAELKRLQRVNELGTEGADFLTRVESLVMSGSMSFSEAFELEASIDKMQKLNQSAAEFQQLLGSAAQRVGSAIENSIGVAIDSAINGADDLGQKLQSIASNLLSDVGRMFLRAGVSGLGAAFKIPGFASGGTMQPNSLAVVGERGPELIANGPSSTRVFSNNDSRQMLNTATEQREVMTRYRPDGGKATGAINVNYNGPTMTFNNEEFVPKSAVPDIIKAAAKQGATAGHTRSMTTLKNSRSQRSKLGMR